MSFGDDDDFWANMASYVEDNRKEIKLIPGAGDLPFSLDGFDLSMPPGFTGEVAQWIESQSRRPRRHISAAAAIMAIANIAGLRYIDEHDGVTTNLFIFCVAGSRTGKDNVQNCIAHIHRIVSYGGATHGSIKSEQEIVRNLIRHQSSLYVIDEIGILLGKIKNAQQRGGAAYLDGVIGMLMSAYSKASKFMLLTGDVKEQVRDELKKELAQINKRIDENEASDWDKSRFLSIKRALGNLDNGLERPFLSLIGFTTPVTFDELVDYQSATNGFIGRSLIFNERDTAPRSKKDFFAPDMPQNMEMRLMQICHGGYTPDPSASRIEAHGEYQAVETTPEAASDLSACLDWLEDQAVQQRDSGGLEALWLGSYELVAKISFILAIPDGVRTPLHVRWAFALVKRDVEDKIRMVTGNDRAKDAPQKALRARIEALTGGDEGLALGTLVNRLRGFTKDSVEQEVADMVDGGLLLEEVTTHPRNKREVKKYRLVRL